MQPLCLVFEDLHWIDSETQALLDNLVESLPTTQVLLLVNYRPEYQHGWGNKTYYSQLRVDPLSSDSADELLRAMVGDSAELASLRPLLIDRTQGNPFFLEESVRALVETGVLAGERGAYRLTKPLENITVPATVQAILAARIDRLAPEEKRLLQTAAVLGKDIPFALLKAIVEESEDDLHRSLTRLQAAELLYETRLFPELEYTFKHALTHEVAYGSLLHERRRMLHARIVEAIERLYPDGLLEQVERLAYHAFQGELWSKATTYLHQAGTKTGARSAYREAVAYFEQALIALARLPESDETLTEAIDIRVELGPMLMATKGPDSPEVEAVYKAARELFPRLGETPQLFAVLWGLSLNTLGRENLQAGHEIAKQLLPLAERLQDNALLLEAHHTLWTTSARLGELASAQAHLEQGFKLYDPQEHRQLALRYGGHDPGVCCRYHAAEVAWLLGYPDQALKHVDDALRLARELTHLSTLAFALTNAACVHQYRGEQRAAEEQLETLGTLAVEQELTRFASNASFMRGRLMTEQGRGQEGIALMCQNSRGTGRLWTYFATLLADAYDKEGKTEEGLGEVNKALARVDKMGQRDFEAELLRIKGDLVLRQAVPAERQAEAYFQEAIDVSRRQGAKSLELRAVMRLSRLLHQQGRTDEARQMLKEIYEWFTEGFDTADLKEAKELLDELT